MGIRDGHQGVSIRRGGRDILRRDRAAGSGPVLDNDGLLPDLIQALRQDTSSHVGCAARGESDQDADRAVGKVADICLLRSDRRGECTQDRCERGRPRCSHCAQNFLPRLGHLDYSFGHKRSQGDGWMCAMRTSERPVRTRDRDQVAALANGLRAVEAFSTSRQYMTVADVARQTGMTRAATRRYLLTLTACGYAQTDGKRFQLTSRVLRLGHAYISSVPLPQIAQPIVEDLGHRTDESVALTVLEVSESLTIATSAPRRIVGIFTRIGTHLPALSTATGRAVLAGRTDDAIKALLRAERIQKLTPKTKTAPAEIWQEIHRIRELG